MPSPKATCRCKPAYRPTPEKIRDLQRKLYLKAKNEPTFRFIYCRTKYGVKMLCNTLIAWSGRQKA